MLVTRRRHASANPTFQQITSSATGAPDRQKWRRFDLRSALATTALGTGVLVGASLWPGDSAWAGCIDASVDTSPNTLSCDTAQTTSDDTIVLSNPGTTVVGNWSDRHYQFDDPEDIEVTITTGGLIDGFGLAVSSTGPGAAITVDHQGAISVDDGNTPSEGGTAVFNLTTDGGDITYIGNGSVIDNDDGNPGLVMDTGAGAGDINIGTDLSPVTPTYQGSNALETTSGTGEQNIFLDGGSLTPTLDGGWGLRAIAAGGDITIDLRGNTVISAAAGPATSGVSAFSPAGNISISSDANIGTDADRARIGVFAQGAEVDVTLTGGTIFFAQQNGVLASGETTTVVLENGAVIDGVAGLFGTGIQANAFAGPGSIDVGAASSISMDGGTGIFAAASGATGGVSVNVDGAVTGADLGIRAFISNAANPDDVIVTTSGVVEAGEEQSIWASTQGTGNVTANLSTGASLEGGVLVESITGNAAIVAGDDVTVDGNSPGAASITAGGDATQVWGDNADVSGSSGLVVDQTSLAGAGVATVEVGADGTIVGDGTDPTDDYNGNGIFAGNQGTGATSVATGTGTSVTGASNGIVAVQTNPLNVSDITISTDGPVSGGGAILPLPPSYAGAFGGLPETGLGIGVANEGTGAIIVTAGDSVTGANVGIQTLAAGGGDTSITTDAVTGGEHGIRAVATAGGGISVTTSGAVEGTTGDGIVTSAVNGNTVITANAARVEGANFGANATSTGTGTITVTGAGNYRGGAQAGISAVMTGAGPGAGNDGIVVSGTGRTTSTAGTAIIADIQNAANDSDILITRSGAVNGAAGGIDASTSGGGDVAISGTGAVTTTAGTGVSAAASGGDVVIASDGAVSGATGIAASTTGAGTVTVTANAVTGTAGDGIVTSAENGNTAITANGAVTGADDGIDAAATGTGSVAIAANAAVTGDDDGIFARTTTGNIAITGGGPVTGDDDADLDGDGINAASTAGGSIAGDVGAASGASGVVLSVVGAGTIDLTTGGTVVGTVGDGINTSAFNGNTAIETNGAVSGADDGIDAAATGAGAISILADATVTGADDGIVTSTSGGDTAIQTNAAVSGGGDDGIDATATGAGAISIVANDSVTGADDGIVTSAVNGDTTIAANGSLVRGQDGIDATATGGGSIDVGVGGGARVTGLSGAGVSTDTATGQADIENAGLIQGAFAAISGATSTVLEVVNQAGGLIRNLSGDIGDLAISVTGTGMADIENDGAIRGRIELDSGNDTFTNSGLWAATGVSDFGAGIDSVLNTGRVSVAEQAAMAEITHFDNLEFFTNAGTGVIDMVDDNAPNVRDELTIDGVYTGIPGSIVEMDLALVSGDPQAGSDLLILDGANPAQGTSDFVFNIVSTGVTATTADANRVAFAGGQLLAAPVTVVENRGNLTTSSGDDEIPLARSGLINYDLVSTAAAGGEYQVVSRFDAGLAGGLLLPIPATLAAVAFTSQRTPNPITATCIDPDNKATAQGGWVRGLAGEFNTESSGEATTGGVASDLESKNRTRYETLQGGFDHVWCNLGNFASTFHLGVTVGQTWGDSIQEDPDRAAGIFGTDVSIDTFFVGPYAAMTRGNFAAQAALRFDYHSLELSNPTIGVDANDLDVDAKGISGSASMSYDFELATLTLTPDVGVNVSNTEIDSFDIAGGTVALEDLWSVMGHAGVTARTQPLGVADNLFVVPFASATVYHEFVEHADGEFDIGGSVIESESNRVGTFGQLGIGANAVRLGDVVAGRPTLFGGARLDLQVGERIDGASATVFGRVQF